MVSGFERFLVIIIEGGYWSRYPRRFHGSRFSYIDLGIFLTMTTWTSFNIVAAMP